MDNERETLSLLSWNINGWYENTKHIRANIITGLNPDIAVVCETHLKPDEQIYVNNFHCISHNRKGHIRIYLLLLS